MDYSSVSVKQEIPDPEAAPIDISSGGSSPNTSAGPAQGDIDDDALFDLLMTEKHSNLMTCSTSFGENNQDDGGMAGAGAGAEAEAEASREAKRPRCVPGRLGFASPLGFLQPLPPLSCHVPYFSSTNGSGARALVKVEAEIPRPLAAWRSGETVGRYGSEVVRRSGSCRQFWKAGDFEGGADEDCASSSVGMDHVRVHPKFLHSNATSHKWALGAFAELLDNSLDEVCNGATHVNVDMLKNEKDGTRMLLVEDDGGGMTPDKMRQCMSLGYSAKSKQANTIGQYGNGFKTSTMRLGADVIVFSRCPGHTHNASRPTQTIGMLSYSFLRGTGKEDIVVPMIDFEKSGQGWKMMMRSSIDDWYKNLGTIIQWSPYSSEEDLLRQFNCMKEHGTRVVIYSLWEDDEGQLELDFDADPHDIQIRGVNRDERNIQMALQYPNSRHYLTYRHSLRSYASILYLRLPPSFRIILRGKDVEHHNLVNDMMLTKQMTYRPQISEGIMTKDSNMFADVTIGFVKDAHYHIDVQGFNVYHKNRLIKPFWRVWNAAGSNGRGVVGVLEANFVEPAHDKQGFERTTVLSRLEARLLAMQKNYWSSNCQKVGYVGSAGWGSKTKSKKPNNDKPSWPVTDQGSTRVVSESSIEPQKDIRSVERLTGTREQGVKVSLLNHLKRERERRISLETNLRETEQKIQELDKEQVALIDLLVAERKQREEEEETLKKQLNEAYKTIEDQREKIRQLEAMNGFCCKEEK